ncbi:RNA binding protein [[Candida] boidinii]|nr:RNA binding protein [[Candida] boidinii]
MLQSPPALMVDPSTPLTHLPLSNNMFNANNNMDANIGVGSGNGNGINNNIINTNSNPGAASVPFTSPTCLNTPNLRTSDGNFINESPSFMMNFNGGANNINNGNNVNGNGNGNVGNIQMAPNLSNNNGSDQYIYHQHHNSINSLSSLSSSMMNNSANNFNFSNNGNFHNYNKSSIANSTIDEGGVMSNPNTTRYSSSSYSSYEPLTPPDHMNGGHSRNTSIMSNPSGCIITNNNNNPGSNISGINIPNSILNNGSNINSNNNNNNNNNISNGIPYRSNSLASLGPKSSIGYFPTLPVTNGVSMNNQNLQQQEQQMNNVSGDVNFNPTVPGMPHNAPLEGVPFFDNGIQKFSFKQELPMSNVIQQQQPQIQIQEQQTQQQQIPLPQPVIPQFAQQQQQQQLQQQPMSFINNNPYPVGSSNQQFPNISQQKMVGETQESQDSLISSNNVSVRHQRSQSSSPPISSNQSQNSVTGINTNNRLSMTFGESLDNQFSKLSLSGNNSNNNVNNNVNTPRRNNRGSPTSSLFTYTQTQGSLQQSDKVSELSNDENITSNASPSTTVPSAATSSSFSSSTMKNLALDKTTNILELSRDQYGCRWLQKKIDEDFNTNFPLIFNAVYQHSTELMMDPFGNYLIQKLLIKCSHNDINLILTNVSVSIFEISKNQHGTRACQKLIDCLQTSTHFKLLQESLSPYIVNLIQDLNGNHVIQKCIQKFQNSDLQFIIDSICGNMVQVSTHKHGCCVLQKCLTKSNHAQINQLGQEIIRNAIILTQDPFGNYVVQYLITLEIMELNKDLVTLMGPFIGELSVQKFSSNVVEKCLRIQFNVGNDTSYVNPLYDSLLLPNVLQTLIKDQFGNYVIQTALDCAPVQNKIRLSLACRPLLYLVQSTSFGKRIQHKINNILIQFDNTNNNNNGTNNIVDISSVNIDHSNNSSNSSNSSSSVGSTNNYKSYNNYSNQNRSRHSSVNLTPPPVLHQQHQQHQQHFHHRQHMQQQSMGNFVYQSGNTN